MSVASCPICKKPAAPRRQNPTFPFCGERCRLIDLGNWLGETYRVPDEREKPSLADQEQAEAKDE